MSTNLWCCMPKGATFEYLDALHQQQPSAFNILNESEIGRYLYQQGEHCDVDEEEAQPEAFIEAEWLGFPTPRLGITDAGFRFHYFSSGLDFVSSALADALDLANDAVQYFDVDCSACAPEVRAMGYRVMHLRAYANPLDPARMPAEDFGEYVRRDGSMDVAWMKDGPGQDILLPHPWSPLAHIAWRQDFVAPAPLFRVSNATILLATDACAERVMRAGIEDVAFIDITAAASRAGNLVYRQLGD